MEFLTIFFINFVTVKNRRVLKFYADHYYDNYISFRKMVNLMQEVGEVL